MAASASTADSLACVALEQCLRAPGPGAASTVGSTASVSRRRGGASSGHTPVPCRASGPLHDGESCSTRCGTAGECEVSLRSKQGGTNVRFKGACVVCLFARRSGGSDSVALLVLLNHLKHRASEWRQLDLRAVHFNHKLRPAADEEVRHHSDQRCERKKF
jgi:hypothetical protein